MKKLARKEIAIGISVIAAILILIFGIEFLKGINLFRPSHFYMAYYDNVAGLEVSAPVKINGYKVGQVREINFDYERPGKTEVLLALNKNLNVPEDSYATLGSSIMGEAYVEIHLGSSKKMLAVGSVINTSESGGIMDQITNSIIPKVGQTLENVDTMLLSLNDLLSESAVRNTVLRLDGISDNILLASQGLNTFIRQDVPGLVRNADGVVSNINGIAGNVGGIVGNIGGIVYNIDTISGNLAALTGELNNLPLKQTMESVNATVNNLEAFSLQLKNQNSTLGKLLNDPELYNRINNVAASVDSLIIDIKKNPKRYINIKLL